MTRFLLFSSRQGLTVYPTVSSSPLCSTGWLYLTSHLQSHFSTALRVNLQFWGNQTIKSFMLGLILLNFSLGERTEHALLSRFHFFQLCPSRLSQEAFQHWLAWLQLVHGLPRALAVLPFPWTLSLRPPPESRNIQKVTASIQQITSVGKQQLHYYVDCREVV